MWQTHLIAKQLLPQAGRTHLGLVPKPREAGDGSWSFVQWFVCVCVSTCVGVCMSVWGVYVCVVCMYQYVCSRYEGVCWGMCVWYAGVYVCIYVCVYMC